MPRTGRHDLTALLNLFFCQRVGRTRPRLDRRQVSSYALRAESSPSLLRDSAATKIGWDLLRPGGQRRICNATHTALWGSVAARCVWQTSLPDSQARLRTRICENSLSIVQLKEEFQAQKNRLKWPVSLGLCVGRNSQCVAIWCPEGDSNSHSFRKRILNPPRLPIPPSGLNGGEV